MDKKVTIGNVCFIKDTKNNKILFLKRNREPMQNMYTGVGGKTDFDEDIYTSCIREVKEEIGLDVKNLKLKGVLKTILHEKKSSWILFIYVASNFDGNLINCNEGELDWLDYILDEKSFIEGTIVHDICGNVLSKKLNISCLKKMTGS